MNTSISEKILGQLRTATPLGRVITDRTEQAGFVTELRDLFHGSAAAVVQPGSVEEVQAVMQLAHENNIAVVPQGGNTGLVGAQIPDQTGSQLIVSLSRLNKIRNLSADGRTMGVEAGVTLQQINEAAEDADLLFPLSIASRGSCQLGGFLSTNAGGTAVLTYGNARDMVLGLEVVLADGTLWNGLNRLRKNNTGYDLKHLFIGGEGTLGIITAAELKLFDPPQGKSTAFAGMVDIDKVHQLFRAAKSQAGRGLVAFEFIPRIGIEFVLKHGAETRDPLSEPHNWYVLLEITSEQSDQSADEMMQSVLASALENGAIDDAVIAQSEDQSSQFWYVRDIMSEVQRPEGGSIKHDIAVPVAELPTYLPEAMALVRRLVPGCRPVPFGHYGDGNVHFNISQPIGMEKAAFLDHWDEVSHQVHDLTVSVGGTFSAEHGVGALKRASMLKYKDPVELQLMAKIKQTLDPQGILNPGKLLPDQ